MRDISLVIDEILAVPGLPEPAARELEALAKANAYMAPEQQASESWREGACILSTRLVNAPDDVVARVYEIWTGRRRGEGPKA